MQIIAKYVYGELVLLSQGRRVYPAGLATDCGGPYSSDYLVNGLEVAEMQPVTGCYPVDFGANTVLSKSYCAVRRPAINISRSPFRCLRTSLLLVIHSCCDPSLTVSSITPSGFSTVRPSNYLASKNRLAAIALGPALYQSSLRSRFPHISYHYR